MQHNLLSATLENYELKTTVFESVQPDELLFYLNNFNKSIYGNDNTSKQICINNLHTLIYIQPLQDFDTPKNHSTVNLKYNIT